MAIPRSASTAITLTAATALLGPLWTLALRPPPARPLTPVAAQPEADPATPDEPLPEVMLVLVDGRQVTGLLVRRTDDEIVLRVGGVEVTHATDTIRRLVERPPVLEQYRTLLDSIAPDDAESLVSLAEWLRSVELYRLALDTVNEALAVDPSVRGGQRLKLWLDSQLSLRRVERRPDAQDAGPRTGDADAAAPPFPLLTPEDINIIRVFEVDLNAPPRMAIPRSTVEQLLDEYAGSDFIPTTRAGRERFLRQPPAKILEVMFRLRARHLYGQVQILEDPASMRTFKQRIHGRGAWLVNACSSVRCHGGTEAGRLRLYNRRPNSDKTTYTNFIILDRYRLDDGTPLINYDDPASSPLLHLATLRHNALFKHPEAGPSRGSRGWRPIFRSPDDARFRQAADWIASLYTPRPDYPIDYEPPAPSVKPDEEPEPQVDR